VFNSCLICCINYVRVIWWSNRVTPPSIDLLSLLYTWLLIKWRLLLLLLLILLLTNRLWSDLRRKLVLLYLRVLRLLHEAERLRIFFAIKFLFVILQESVILNNFIFYMWETSHNVYLTLAVYRFCLIALNIFLFHRGYEFITYSYNISREVCPFNLRFVQCLFSELFFFL
jgi:hypothetical protein